VGVRRGVVPHSSPQNWAGLVQRICEKRTPALPRAPALPACPIASTWADPSLSCMQLCYLQLREHWVGAGGRSPPRARVPRTSEGCSFFLKGPGTKCPPRPVGPLGTMFAGRVTLLVLGACVARAALEVLPPTAVHVGEVWVVVRDVDSRSCLLTAPANRTCTLPTVHFTTDGSSLAGAAAAPYTGPIRLTEGSWIIRAGVVNAAGAVVSGSAVVQRFLVTPAGAGVCVGGGNSCSSSPPPPHLPSVCTGPMVRHAPAACAADCG
jgi:hypothetical protein